MARYEINAGGRVYHVDANDDDQAQQIADWIQSRVAAGDEDLRGAAPPLNATVNPTETTSATGAAARGAIDTGYYGWGDEFSAFGNAAGLAFLDNLWPGEQDQHSFMSDPGGFWGAFEHNMRRGEAEREADRQQHPMARGAGQVTGALATILPTTRLAGAAGNIIARAAPRVAIPVVARAEAAAIGAPVRTSLARGAAISAPVSAVAAAGEGRGNRAQSAAIGALAGAMFGPFADLALTQVAPAIGRYIGTIVGHAPREEAVTQVVQALQRDGYNMGDPAAVQLLRQELSRYAGRPVTLADIGNATRARTGVGLRTPSGAQTQSIDTVMSRQRGQGERLSRDIRANVAPRTDVHALDDALVQQRAQEAERLRRRALYENPDAEQLFMGGAPFNSDYPGVSFLTADRDVAQSYANMHAERTGSPGQITEVNANISSPAPQNIVEEAARRSGIDTASSTPASWFDINLHGEEPVQRLLYNLRARGYDSARLPDIPYGQGRGETTAIIPFDNSTVSAAQGTSGLRSRVVNDPVLNRLARIPDSQRALRSAVQQSRRELDIAQAQGQPTEHLGAGIFDEDQLQSLLDSGAALDVRTLDMLKRHLDDEVNALYRRGQGNTFSAAEAAQVRDLRNAIRERLRVAVPEYGDYLDAYSASSDMIDALRAGRGRVPGEPGTEVGFDRLDPERITAEQADRSQAGQELYRVGAARRLEDIVRDTRDSASPAMRILNDDTDRARLEALGLQPGAADRLNTAVGQERTFSLLRDELRGSQTAERVAAARDAEANLDVPFNPASGFGWAGALLRGVGRRLSTTHNAAVNEQILPMLLEQNPAAIEGVINELASRGELLTAERLRRAAVARRRNLVGSNLIGGAVALPNRGE